MPMPVRPNCTLNGLVTVSPSLRLMKYTAAPCGDGVWVCASAAVVAATKMTLLHTRARKPIDMATHFSWLRLRNAELDRRRCGFFLPARFGVALRARGGASREFEELAEQTGRDHRDRINAQYRRAGRTHDLIGEADQPLVAAAAQDLPEDRNLPEHVVEAVEGHDSAAHMHIVIEIIDVAVGGGADHRAFDEALANGEAAVRAGELDPHAGEIHARLVRAALPVRRIRSSRDPLECGFAAD